MSTLPPSDAVRFLQLDVFTDRPGGGNPLGVVIGAQGWDADDMQRFAVWTNLVETTFLLPPTEPKAHYRKATAMDPAIAKLPGSVPRLLGEGGAR